MSVCWCVDGLEVDCDCWVMAMQDGQGAMLDDWQENIAIMAANRTQGDERVMLHLGDRLWGVRGEVGVIRGSCIGWWDGRGMRWL